MYGHQDDLNCLLTQLEELHCRMDIKEKAISLAYVISNSAPLEFHYTKLSFGTISCADTMDTSRL